MTDTTATIQRASVVTFLRGLLGVRQLRLATGIVLFTFLISHFTNHAMGNISLDAMEEALNTHHRIWGEQPGKAIFYICALVHAALGIWMLYERRQFRYGATEATQLVLGLSIPALLIAHIADARLAYDLFGNEKYYSQLFAFYTNSRPYMIGVQYLVNVRAPEYRMDSLADLNSMPITATQPGTEAGQLLTNLASYRRTNSSPIYSHYNALLSTGTTARR